jgi:hypothetical protein
MIHHWDIDVVAEDAIPREVTWNSDSRCGVSALVADEYRKNPLRLIVACSTEDDKVEEDEEMGSRNGYMVWKSCLATTTSIVGARLLSSCCGLGVGFAEKARPRHHGGGIKRMITFSENFAPRRRAGSQAWVRVCEDFARECGFGEASTLTNHGE